jgi:glycosyltransferase involved in cell wall biosynthesis
MRPSVKRADCIITISESTATDLRAIYPDCGDKITVIHPASQILELETDLTVASNIGEPFILFVGTLETRKNLIGLLNAYRRLPSEIQDQYMLVIAGGKGWGSLDLDKNISEMELEGRVTQTGYIPDKQLVGLYKEAQLLVMPSFYEGFGLPILEAMSVGTPVITSNVSSMPEIAGDAAITVDPYDSREIAEAIVELLKNATRRKELIAKGYERCKMFSWKSAASKLIQIFEETV